MKCKENKYYYKLIYRDFNKYHEEIYEDNITNNITNNIVIY